jgi:hypothetical protein
VECSALGVGGAGQECSSEARETWFVERMASVMKFGRVGECCERRANRGLISGSSEKSVFGRALRAQASCFRRLEQPLGGCSQVARLEPHAQKALLAERP